MQQIVLEVDFPHPSYLSGGGHCALTLQLQCLENASSSPEANEHWEGSATMAPLWAFSLLLPGVKSMPGFDPRVALHFLQECTQNLEKSLQQMPCVQLPATARKTTRAIFCLMSSGHLRPGQPDRALQFPQDGDESLHSEPVLCFRTISSPVLGSKMQVEIPESRSKPL